MDTKEKLILAKIQVDNLVELFKGNEYESFLYSKLVSIDVEIQRQLSHYKYDASKVSSNVNQ
jgi:hypothetical protein